MSPDVDRAIGTRVIQARETHPAMTHQHVAGYLGIPVDDVRAIEAGEMRPSSEQLILLADLLNVKPSWFFEGLGDGH